MITVRILAVNDQMLTRFYEATGRGPQYIVDEALEQWFATNAHLLHDDL